MLEFCKKILVKVSFDRHLFAKELRKSVTWISDPSELQKLREWCIGHYGAQYGDLIQRAFSPVLA
jgi:hypothetical protein